MEGRSGRRLLILSIVLNIFLIGAIVGGTAIWLGEVRPAEAGGQLRLAGERLPEAQRTALRKALRETRRVARPIIREGRAGRAEAARLLAQPTLDVPALEAALARVRRSDGAMRARLEARTIAFAATLSPADRARMADGLIRRGARRDRR